MKHYCVTDERFSECSQFFVTMFEQLPGWTFAATHPIALKSHRFGARAHWLIVELEIKKLKAQTPFFSLRFLSPRLIERSSEWVWFNSCWFKTSLTLTLSSPAYIYLSAFPAHSFCLFLRGIVGGNPRQCHVSVEASRMHTCGLAQFFIFFNFFFFFFKICTLVQETPDTSRVLSLMRVKETHWHTKHRAEHRTPQPCLTWPRRLGSLFIFSISGINTANPEPSKACYIFRHIRQGANSSTRAPSVSVCFILERKQNIWVVGSV